MDATCLACGERTAGADSCGAHPRLLLCALWGEVGGGEQERLQSAYLAAQTQALSSDGHWESRRFKQAAVRELLPWRASERGELAQVLRKELKSSHSLAEAEIASALGLSELRAEMGGFEQEDGLCASALRRDLEIKAAGGKEPSDVDFMEAHKEFERGLEANLDAATLGERLRTHLDRQRAGVALMLHCEIIDSTGKFFEGTKAVRAAELAAVLGLEELDEVVYMFSDQCYSQAQITLGAAEVLARRAGGAHDSTLDGDEA